MMTHTFLQLANKLFVGQVIFAGVAAYLTNVQNQNVSLWHWILGIAGVYVYSAVLAGIVRLLTTRTQ